MTLKPSDSFDIYSEGLMYDSESGGITEDLPFYLRQAKAHGGPILELACGTGRVSIPLAQAGFEVVGLDISAPMLDQARLKAKTAKVQIEWVEADCRQFALGRKFPLILFPFNAIAHIHDRESHEALFDRVREHLTPEGRFVFSWFNPNPDFLYRDPDKRYPNMEFDDPHGRGKVVITESNVYDSATQINHIVWYYKIGDAEEYARELNMRMLFPQELDALLHHNGFELEAKYGDFDESPFESSSRQQVCICRCR